MDTPQTQPEDHSDEMSQEELLEAMFSNLVVQQTRTALYTLGQIPDPQSGQRVLDLDTAQMLIATLEMLKAKTEGNLSEKEDGLITKSIEQLHDIFERTIAAIEKAHAEKGAPTEQGEPSESGLFTPPTGIFTPSGAQATTSTLSQEPQAPAPAPQEQPAPSLSSQAEKEKEEESRKRFSKKY